LEKLKTVGGGEAESCGNGKCESGTGGGLKQGMLTRAIVYKTDAAIFEKG